LNKKVKIKGSNKKDLISSVEQVFAKNKNNKKLYNKIKHECFHCQ